jgi:putative ABC transport system permease protein
MHWLHRLWHKSVAERQLDSELNFHLEQQISAYVASGIPPEEARRRANLEFGGVERFKEECRETRTENPFDILLRDFRFAFRGLLKDRKFALIAMFALALGIGSSTAIFSVIDNVLLHPFAYKDTPHLVTLRLRDLDQQDHARGMFTRAELNDYTEQNHVFDRVIGNLEDDIAYTAFDHTVRLGGNYVTPGSFELLGMPAYLGRSLEPADYQAGAAPVFVLRYLAWMAQFDGDPSVVGKTFALNGVSRTLVGVMPPRFAWGGADLWLPRSPENREVIGGGRFPNYWGLIAHLKQGVSMAEAAADLEVIVRRRAAAFPGDYPKHFSVEIEPFALIGTGRHFRSTLAILFTAVALLLLIGCGNVANLLLARATTREREFAVRAALGASRARLMSQLLVESLLLAIGGAVAGIFFAWGGVKILSASIPPFTIASESVVEMNGAVLLFALCAAVGTVLVFGLAPALRASRCCLHDSLRDNSKAVTSSAGAVRLRNAVIVAEVALSLTLLFTAGLFTRSFRRLLDVPLGLRSDHVLVVRMPLPPERYKTATQLVSFFRPLITRLKSTPGVESASAMSSIPAYGGIRSELQISGKTHTEKWETIFQLCSQDHFSLLRIPLLDGRSFLDDEVNDGRKVAVINKTFQRRYFGNENPIGKRIHLETLKTFPDPVSEPWFEVIGIAADVKNQGVQEPTIPEAWIPYTVTGSAMRGILVRTTGDPRAMVRTVGREVWAVDSSVAMAEPQTLDSFLNVFSYAQPRLGFLLVTVFASIGLLLVTIGVYSVIAYSTSRRTHEIGLRMALGAAARDVMTMILGQGLRLLGMGIAIGLLGSVALARVIVAQLWGVSPYEPLTFASVAILLLSIGLLACWVPARRATRIDPTTALRYE